MKYKILLTALLMAMCSQTMWAQSMTEKQIITYAKQRKNAGADAKTIGTELLEKGATKEQIQKIYADYQTGSIDGDDRDMAPQGIDRERQYNGEDAPEFMPNQTTEDGRVVFGRDIFRSKRLSFEPNMNVAIPQSYVLGPGDELIVDVYGASQASNKYKVAPDGSVVIPRIGPVGVSGLTVEKAQAKITKAMGEHYQNSSIKVSVGQTRTISISVMGEVKTPGTYRLSAFSTVFHALYMAGGTSSIGTLRDIHVARNGKIISTVDIYEYIMNGRLAGSVDLKDGDVIMVNPYQCLVNISGNVRRPMWYEMKSQESLKTLLGFAGGFKGDAYTKTVRVERRAGDKLSVYNVSEFDQGTFAMMDEDSVMVDVVEERYENSVKVNGSVKRPGNFDQTKVKTVRGLIEAAGGLEEDANPEHGVLIRMNEDRSTQAISLDIKGILSGATADFVLKNEDELTISSLARLHAEQNLVIEGEVYAPGTYKYSDKITVKDLVTLAGGLRESASVLNVEVSRRIIDATASKERDIRTETFTFALKEGLGMEDGSRFPLMPYDHVYIRRSPVYNEQYSVYVSGEVMFAGNYVLADNHVRLSEVITRAGGLKTKASAHDARLIRRMDATELARQNQMLQMARTSADSIDIEKLDSTATYTVAIDLEKAMDKPGSNYDVVLRDGDQIIIPQRNTTVKVNGEVLHPNSITYMDGKNYKYYVNEAGGFTKDSQKRKSYIVYANGHVSKVSKGKVEPGCEIVVPTKPKRDGAAISKWGTVVTGFVTAAALIITALK